MGELRLNEGCSLKLCVPEGYPEEFHSKAWELIELFTVPEKREQGFARQLLENVCQEADSAGMGLLIHMEPYGAGQNDSKRLQSFYASLGFVVFQTKPTLMCRPPGKPEWKKSNRPTKPQTK